MDMIKIQPPPGLKGSHEEPEKKSSNGKSRGKGNGTGNTKNNTENQKANKGGKTECKISQLRKGSKTNQEPAGGTSGGGSVCLHARAIDDRREKPSRDRSVPFTTHEEWDWTRKIDRVNWCDASEGEDECDSEQQIWCKDTIQINYHFCYDS